MLFVRILNANPSLEGKLEISNKREIILLDVNIDLFGMKSNQEKEKSFKTISFLCFLCYMFDHNVLDTEAAKINCPYCTDCPTVYAEK
jgi:hypothetical protein